MNSLTTIPTNGNQDWCKIKIVEGMDLITYFLRTTIENSYLGKFPNTYDNKQLLVTAISEYFKYLEQEGVLSPGESSVEVDYDRQLQWLKSQGVEVASLTRQQILEYQTGSWVFIKCRGRLTDAMEDFEVSFDALGYGTVYGGIKYGKIQMCIRDSLCSAGQLPLVHLHQSKDRGDVPPVARRCTPLPVS